MIVDLHTAEPTPKRWTRRRWPWIVLCLVLLLIGGALVTVSVLAGRIQPYVRKATIEYLESRFDSSVELGDLKVDVPAVSAVHLAATRGKGVVVRVEGQGLTLRHKSRTDIPPLLTLRRFKFTIDLAALFDPHRSVRTVTLDGLKVAVPPRPESSSAAPSSTSKKDESVHARNPGASGIDEVIANDAELVILPRDPSKVPLDFRIHTLHLHSVGVKGEMTYDAMLTNPKPPGQIQSSGNFGPWNSDEPAKSPLHGHYTFTHADLSVFRGIAGILNATGDFNGQLDTISTHGTARVPDFRLRSSGNPVPLTATYDALVDGANGDTVLKPVSAVLGGTSFTTSGAVLRNGESGRHSITLDVNMPRGRLEDVLRVGLRGPVMMRGEISLRSKIRIPPASGTVNEKLVLDGDFHIAQGQFLNSTMQGKLDELSRRAQGQPKNQAIDQVFSDLGGKFHMEDHVIALHGLSFLIPGAKVQLDGNYDLAQDQIDMHGSLSLDAKVSQTMTGWKRIVLKPADPFFSKNGAGTYLKIRLDGTAKDPHYGLDHQNPDVKKEH
jgi:hypothetical protein